MRSRALKTGSCPLSPFTMDTTEVPKVTPSAGYTDFEEINKYVLSSFFDLHYGRFSPFIVWMVLHPPDLCAVVVGVWLEW